MIFDLLVIAVIAVVVSSAWNVAYHWGLSRKIYTLECDVADLQTKILSEIKKRAQSNARKRPEDELLSALGPETAAKPPEPWWMKYAGNQGP